MKLTTATKALLFSAAISLSSAYYNNRRCPPEDPSRVQVISIASDDINDLDDAFTLYQNMLGGGRLNSAATPDEVDPNGLRRISWDGPVPLDMPGDFFAATFDQGMTVASPNNKFIVSDDGNGDSLLDSVNPAASRGFIPFSSPRIFSPVSDNTISITFSVPGTSGAIPAHVSGMGVMFLDVDRPFKTFMTLKDVNGCVLARSFVPPNPEGLSFLGIRYDEKIVASVEMTYGTEPLDGEEAAVFGGGYAGGRQKDIVAMDDFIFDEPEEQ